MARSIITSLRCLTAIALLAACSPTGGPEPAMTTPTTANALTYLALGDSYTIGESVETAERWPLQLAAALQAEGIEMAEPVIIARTGWTTANLLAAVEREPASEPYDLVSLLIGVNNQYQNMLIETYRAEFKELLGYAIEAAGGRADHVIVLSIPDWGFTPYAERINRDNISEEIDAFNAVAQAESEAAGVPYFDITQLTRPTVFDPELNADDGLHPSGKMYGLWVEKVLPYVLGLFGN